MRWLPALAVFALGAVPGTAQTSKPDSSKIIPLVNATKTKWTHQITWGDEGIPQPRSTPKGLVFQRLLVSPNGKHFAMQVQGEIHVLNLANKQWHEPTDVSNEASLAMVFDDGSCLMLDQGKVVRATVDGVERIGKAEVPEIVDAFATPDGKRVLSSGLTANYKVVVDLHDLGSGESRRLKRPSRSASVSAAAWSEDRRHVAIAWCEIGEKGRQPISLVVYDKEGETVREFGAGEGVVRSVAFSLDERSLVWTDDAIHRAAISGDDEPASVARKLALWSEVDPVVAIGIAQSSTSKWDAQGLRRIREDGLRRTARIGSAANILDAAISADRHTIVCVTSFGLRVLEID